MNIWIRALPSAAFFALAFAYFPARVEAYPKYLSILAIGFILDVGILVARRSRFNILDTNALLKLHLRSILAIAVFLFVFFFASYALESGPKMYEVPRTRYALLHALLFSSPMVASSIGSIGIGIVGRGQVRP